MNFDQLNQAVKFNREKERAAFEQAIDENPSESTNHLVYADWLEEQGEGDEAAFRRAMGEWHKAKPWAYNNHNDLPPEARPYFPHFLSSNVNALPEGVEWENISPLTSDAGSDFWNAAEHTPRFIAGRHSWISYEGMEEAFRRAFMENRRRGQ